VATIIIFWIVIKGQFAPDWWGFPIPEYL